MVEKISQHNSNPLDNADNWMFAASCDALESKGVLLVRLLGKQIAVFNTVNGVRACDNRCPHEGFPLSEGTLSEDCKLTCNWHNWKFNLDTGENLYGGDELRTYPAQIRGNDIWLDLTEPEYAVVHARTVAGLRAAFEDHAYDRVAREIARLIASGSEPLDVLRLSIDWSWQRMEFGWTHAFAGMADWLVLYNERRDDETRLVCLLESVAHCAWDVLRETEYQYTDKVTDFDESVFLDAIEQEDEETAVAAIRGGLRDGLTFSDFERALTHAALAHYNDFGHSLIYVTKARYLVEQLGAEVTEPLLLSLVRSIVFSSREDKIPEFRRYASALDSWGQNAQTEPQASNWHRRSINKSLDATVACSAAPPDRIYRELLVANAISMLSYDLSVQEKVRVSVSDNVGWLDFTHALTFANAVRMQCERFPDLWPQGLLQMSCFIGRNAAHTEPNFSQLFVDWKFAAPLQGVDDLVEKVIDHGVGEYIVSVHLLKTALSVRDEIKATNNQFNRASELLAAALNRFINSPLKRRFTRRTAHQSIQFVGKQ